MKDLAFNASHNPIISLSLSLSLLLFLLIRNRNRFSALRAPHSALVAFRIFLRLAPIVLLLAVALTGGCSRVSRNAPYPHESVLTVVAELKIFLNQDPYRLPPGQDLNGRNIYRVSLERLQALQGLAGAGRYADVIAFARGECLERLGDWPEAQQAYSQAAQTSSSLASTAAARAETAGRLAGIITRTTPITTLDSYLGDLDARERELGQLQAAGVTFPYDAYLRHALEDIEETRARLLFMNRLILENGASRAIQAARKLVDDHPQSYRASDHQLFLGLVYETMARDWTSLHQPESRTPRLEAGWANWIEQARQAYRKVAQTDGDPAKLEGQARLRALDAYALRVQSLAR